MTKPSTKDDTGRAVSMGERTFSCNSCSALKQAQLDFDLVEAGAKCYIS